MRIRVLQVLAIPLIDYFSVYGFVQPQPVAMRRLVSPDNTTPSANQVAKEPCEGSSPKDCEPRSVSKPNGRVIELAEICTLKAIARTAVVLDVRDANEVEAKKGGETTKDAVHVPINMDGRPQSEHPTTLEEFASKLERAGLLESDVPFVAHCSGGGRASLAVKYLRELGKTAYNGGRPDAVRMAVESVKYM